MKYEFVITPDLLFKVLAVYKKTGGYLEIVENGGNTVTVISDNVKFLYHEDFNEIDFVIPIRPVVDREEVIRKEIINILQELFGDPVEVKTASGPITIPEIGVKPQLQRKKIQEHMCLDYNPEGKRTKWEVIKALQGEFDKFPDNAVFTGVRVVGIGKFNTRYI